ncbi:methyltransferase domain-containing protein [Terriglobus albidus]|uniref:methyltransferase domain-containing protein n=1 Tax=Terriglobus albidus TaxID=1592106 RepID=UPI0021E0AA0B|nr:methyltransferase domain-containing protein [Terriglobus albidus]
MIAAPATPAVFDEWAPVYDDAHNPFCALEVRLLRQLLPSLREKTILDAGCGTGRHFPLLSKLQAKWIHAVDYSAQMLELAKQRLPENATIHQADCTAVPICAQSIDVVLCSLVLGYVSDLPAFCNEMRRLLRPGGQIILADIHPDTAQRRGWNRSFHQHGEEITIGWNRIGLEDLRAIFAAEGFHCVCDLEPGFSEAERGIFVQQDRASAFEELMEEPVMYLLQLAREDLKQELAISGARCALSAYDALPRTLTVERGRVRSILCSSPEPQPQISLDGYLLLPGLINAHDHLEFGLFPRLGDGTYADAQEWAATIQVRYAEAIALHRSVQREARIQWGALRNLLCGVTSVCHHNPITGAMREPEFPVSVVEEMRWVHSAAFDFAGLQEEASIGSGEILIVHAAEGVSERAKQEIEILRALDLLQPSTILVHALAVTPQMITSLIEAGVGLIFCPSSNEFLFGTVPAAALIEDFENAALGSDSPLTACGDLLDEAAFVMARYDLPAARLYSLLMENPATMLRLTDGQGKIQIDGRADLIAVPDRGLSPAETLRHLTWQDVHFVMRNGVVQLVAEELVHILQPSELSAFTGIQVDGRRRWIRADLRPAFEAAAKLQQDGVLRLGERTVALA